MAGKSSLCLLLALIATHNLDYAHFDINSVYVHEQYNLRKPVCIKKMTLLDGIYRYGNAIGILIRNLYGNRMGGHLFRLD